MTRVPAARLPALALALAALAAPAPAQQPAQDDAPEADADAGADAGGDIVAEDLLGVTLYAASGPLPTGGEPLSAPPPDWTVAGEIVNLVLAADGKVTGIVAALPGADANETGRLVAIPNAALTLYDRAGGGLFMVTEATPADLAQAPAFAPSAPSPQTAPEG